MEALLGLDTRLFYFLNTYLVASFLDTLMPIMSREGGFLVPVVVFALVAFIFGSVNVRTSLVVLIVVVVVSDLSSTLLKELFNRIRPCNTLDGIRLLVGCSGSYSFPSAHATNIFAAMVFLSLKFRRFSPVFLTIAFLVSYSRIYVGVHYPLDVLFGAVLGSSFALGFYEADKRLVPFISEYMKKRRESFGVQG